MNIIVTLDDRGAMLFNHRRQSRDGEVIRRITEDNPGLWVSPFSSSLFPAARADENFLGLAGHGDTCFVENRHLKGYEDRIQVLTIYRWNRHYPGDFFFDLDVSSRDWILSGREEFPGTSHEKITKEVYYHA